MPTEKKVKRKLSAILSADVQGYSLLMADDEVHTIDTLKAYRQVIADLISEYSGRVVDSPGDNVLAEFRSSVDAVECAVKIQKRLDQENSKYADDKKVQFRIGVNVGDVIQDGARIYGNGVNVAARIEGLAEAGGVCISRNAYDHIKNKLTLGYEYIGEHNVKNIKDPVRVYKLLMADEDAGTLIGEKPASARKKWVLPLTIVAAFIITSFAWNYYQRITLPDVEPASMKEMELPLPDKPSIAVMPFDNLSDDPEQDYFSNGLTEDIITALSKVPKIFVIARDSVFSFKDKTIKTSQVAEKLGVRYVLEGSIRKSGDKMRITAQLINAISGHHLWAERYDRDLKDIFAVQDDLTKNIITAMQVRLTEGEQAKVDAKGTDNLQAYLKCLQAREQINRFTLESNELGKKLAQESIELDPKYAMAYRMLSAAHRMEVMMGASKSPKQSTDTYIKLLKKAIDLDESYAEAYGALAFSYSLMGKHEEAIATAEKAILLDPNSANTHAMHGHTFRFADKPEEAILAYKKAIRLNPIPPTFYLFSLGLSYSLAGQYDKGIEWCEKAVRNDPDSFFSRLIMAAVYSMAGQIEMARVEALEAQRINPKYSLAKAEKRARYKYKKRIFAALRRAGFPEYPPGKEPTRKPSIAVLPFANMSGDPEQQYFSDGITEQIITSISKVPYIFVIARQSSFAFRDKQLTVQEIAKKLGVRYILEGSLQRSGERLRINAQLIDAKSGHHIWAENYDRKLDDIFAVQDDICKNIMVALQVKLTMGEMARIYADTVNTRAYEKYIQGLEHYWLRTKEGSRNAIKLFQEAIAIDSEYAGAYILLGFAYLDEVLFLMTKTPSESIAKAEAMVQKAAAIEGFMARENNLLGLIYVMKRDYDKAIASAEKAIEQEPSNAGSYLTLGVALRYNGQYEEAIANNKKALQLNPVRPISYLDSLAWAYLGSQQYEKAIANFKETLDRNPNYLFAYMGLTVAYWVTGLEDQAKQAAKHILRINPKFTVSYYEKRPSHKDRAFTKQIFDAWRKAGLPG